MSKIHPSHKAPSFTESVIREMTRLAMQHGAINLAQGFPDFAAPAELKEAAKAAIDADINQYAITWGAPAFRDAIAAQVRAPTTAWTSTRRRSSCVTCGSTEAMIASLLGVLDPGDEVVIFEPFYENYGPDAILSGAVPRYVTLHAPDWTFDEAELRAAFNDRTRGDHRQHAEQPDRQGLLARRARADRASCASAGTRSSSPTRSTSTSSTTGAAHVPLATRRGTARTAPSPSARSRRRTR